MKAANHILGYTSKCITSKQRKALILLCLEHAWNMVSGLYSKQDNDKPEKVQQRNTETAERPPQEELLCIAQRLDH